MVATQYETGLPRDYDMTVIRDRVATRGHALDDYPGLGIKAYLIRDVADGASDNAYAPLYLWTDETAAGRFPWGGDGFAGIVRDFGRPRARHHPSLALKSTLTIPHDHDPQNAAAQADAAAQSLLDDDGLHSVTWAIDPTAWELLIFTLHATQDSVPARTSSAGGCAVGARGQHPLRGPAPVCSRDRRADVAVRGIPVRNPGGLPGASPGPRREG